MGKLFIGSDIKLKGKREDVIHSMVRIMMDRGSF